MPSVIKRARQFFRAVLSKIEPGDLVLIDKYLNPPEKRLFFNMDTAIQKHCVNVARTVLTMIRELPAERLGLLMKAALLHDLGKVHGSVGLPDRVWYVLVRKFSVRLANILAKPGSGSWVARFRNAFYIHLHHPQIGADQAKKAGLDDELVYLIRHHHSKEEMSCRELAVLIQADELN